MWGSQKQHSGTTWPALDTKIDWKAIIYTLAIKIWSRKQKKRKKNRQETGAVLCQKCVLQFITFNFSCPPVVASKEIAFLRIVDNHFYDHCLRLCSSFCFHFLWVLERSGRDFSGKSKKFLRAFNSLVNFNPFECFPPFADGEVKWIPRNVRNWSTCESSESRVSAVRAQTMAVGSSIMGTVAILALLLGLFIRSGKWFSRKSIKIPISMLKYIFPFNIPF